jgi:hypothetical protein
MIGRHLDGCVSSAGRNRRVAAAHGDCGVTTDVKVGG